MNLINYKEVSRLLAGGTENIRSNKTPKKYAVAMKELQDFLIKWVNKYKQ